MVSGSKNLEITVLMVGSIASTEVLKKPATLVQLDDLLEL